MIPREILKKIRQIELRTNHIMVGRTHRRNPVGVETDWALPTQGSSCLATLGWMTQSRWDWPSRLIPPHSALRTPHPNDSPRDP